MRISVKEARDYMRCPLFYKFEYVDNLPGDKSIDSCFIDCIKMSISSYYYSMIENNTKSLDYVLRRWENLWFNSSMKNTFNGEILNKKSNDAIIILTNFFKKVNRDNISPIAVNFPYEVIFIGEKNLHVTGDIDMVNIVNDRTRKRETHITFFRPSLQKPDDFMLRNDIQLTVASYAFRHNFKQKENRIIINSIRCKGDSWTIRNSDDYVWVEKIIRNICRGIEGKIFYPSQNKVFCYNCRFRLFCRNEKAIT